MQKIDIHNYEAYLLDFSEGNLTDELQMELELFLIQHPELNIDLAELSFVSLQEEEVTFSEKNNLKKSETDLISETQFISYIENQLSVQEKLILEKSCAINPALAKELTLYKHTISVADASVIYKNKYELKRKPKVIWFNFTIVQYAAAACVLFLIGLFILWPKTESNNSSSMLAHHPEGNHSTVTNNYTVSTAKTREPNNASTIANKTSLKSSSVKGNQSLLANSAVKQHLPVSNDSAKINNEINNAPRIEQHNNETLLAQNSAPVVKQSVQMVVETITESEDEGLTVNPEKKKKGLWASASRALKNLNNAGVKVVNGGEEEGKEKTSYALTLGGISITHKSGNL